MSDRILRVADVAQLLGCSDDSVLRDIRAGVLGAMRRPRGRAFLIHQAAFDAYLEKIRYVPPPVMPIGVKKAIGSQRRRYRAIAGGRG